MIEFDIFHSKIEQGIEFDICHSNLNIGLNLNFDILGEIPRLFCKRASTLASLFKCTRLVNILYAVWFCLLSCHLMVFFSILTLAC